ncbi:glycosyltransferase family 32 protein [Porphyromonas sp. COT-290 OH860]|uniref:glycosyltransferase family 32 protein n=1 Tax=Porphyromonas sp. COT-290 OH860 TaxID=1515615 RepID=UPI0009E07429|nr:glycosyltransferase [Porphyromonas sp. COT-290 OH860]
MNLSNSYYESLIPVIPQGLSIPKVIYQVGKNRDELHPMVVENIAYLKQINPTWSYTFFDNITMEDFIREEYGAKVLEYYKRIESKYGAARADLFRYLLIYKKGGVYLDLKSSVSRPLNEIIHTQDKYILCHWDNSPSSKHAGAGMHAELLDSLPRGEYQQFQICAVAGHPFLRSVVIDVLKNIDSYNVFKHGVGTMGVYRITGPITYSKSIIKIFEDFKNEARVIDNAIEDSGFIYSIFEHIGHNAHRELTNSIYYKQVLPIVSESSRWRWAVYNTYRKLWYSLHGLSKKIGIHSFLKKHWGGKVEAP